jgi:hypothetical protein
LRGLCQNHMEGPAGYRGPYSGKDLG